MNSNKFKKLFEPFHIGKVQTRNRVIKTVVTTRYWDTGDWHMTEEAKAYYDATAKGKPGILVVECPTIDFPGSSIRLSRYRIDDERYTAGLKELTDIIHKYQTPAFIQFYHCGPWAKQSMIGVQPVAASAVTFPSEFDSHNEVPHALTVPEIKRLVEKFGEASERARRAGFDGVEINAGSSHLIDTFFSRFWNKREDEYGFASLENRSRFAVEILQSIKSHCGKDFPVVMLINAIETGGGNLGLTLAESKELARILENAGADALHIRSHWIGYHIGSFQNEVLFYPEPQVLLEQFPAELDWSHMGWGANAPVAGIIKKEVAIPIITSGRFSPELAEKAIREGKTDFIGICRPMVADTEYLTKLEEGRLDDICPCTRCGECLRMRPEGLRCRVNAATGIQGGYDLKPAEKKKKVVVIGGGPAGMEAARVAASRGHSVELYEKESKLGGLLPLAALVKGTEIEDLPGFAAYLKGQLAKLGVKVHSGRGVTASEIKASKPDVVIVAAGGVADLPKIPGIEKSIVISNASLHRTLKFYLKFFSPQFLRSLTRIWMPLGKRVVIIGGSIHGCELGEFLVKRGRQVTLVEEGPVFGTGMPEERQARLMRWFKQKGVGLYAGAKYEQITDKGLLITTKEGQKKLLEADNVAVALPFKTNTGLLKQFEGAAPEVYAVGDCGNPRLILDAVADGYNIGKQI